MPSTNTSNLNLEKPAEGEQSGEWGDTINSNMELIDAAVATKTGSETLTNKTLTSPVLNTGVSGTAVKDENNMASDSDSHLATQQSIKAYVDSVVSDTTVSGDTGSTGITPGDTLTIAGGTNVSTAMSGDTLTITSTDTMPADDLTTGDAAVTLATSAGNITVDAQGNDTDIIFKGTDGTVDTTYLTLDGSEGGAATLNNGLTLADGNLVVAAGHGIDFSANTHAAGMTSELLDSYEEGTWTCTVAAAGGSFTAGTITKTGAYTKVGRDVHATVYVNNVNTTGASGVLSFTGLPFTVGAVSVGSIGMATMGATNAIGSWLLGTAGATTLSVYYTQNAGWWLQTTISAGTGRYAILDIHYWV
jgi:hypothetical protein